MVVLLLAVYGAVVSAQNTPGEQKEPKPPAGLYQRPSGTQTNEQKEDFLHFAAKQVNPHDFDWGAWIEERRRRFIEASAANPFFWYSTLTTGLLMVLMIAYGVRVLDEKRRLWRAAEILTDAWNDGEHSKGLAGAAIEKHNRHMQECNRVIEAQLSGRASPAALEATDARNELARVRGELDNMDTERKVLKAKLEEKDKLVDNLSARLTALEKIGRNDRSIPTQMPTGANGHDESETKLIARINQLTQQLEAEKQKNRALKGA
jgi:hypothetical protein